MNLKNYRPLGIALCLALLFEGLTGLWSTRTASADPLPSPTGTTYYVSQTNGNDSYDGLAPEWDGVHGPWKTLGKVSGQTYAEGDAIKLKSGDAWNEQLTLRGSGTSDHPITVTSYGSGNRPYIYRNNGIDEEAIRIDNGDGYRIAGLEIAKARRGLRIIADGNTKPRFEHYRIEDNYFHDIANANGSLPGEEGTAIDLVTVPGVKPVFANIAIKNNIFRKTEISYIMWSDGIGPRQEDVTIEGSTFIENGRNQVFQWSGKNVDVLNNLFYYNYPRKYFGVGLTSVLTEHLTGESGVYNEVDGNEFGWAGTYPGDHDGTAYDFEKSGDYIHFTNNFIHDSYRYGAMFMGGQVFNELLFADNTFKDNALGTQDSPFHIWLRADNTGSGTFEGNRFYNEAGMTGFDQKPSSFTYANNADPAVSPGFTAMPLVTDIQSGAPDSRTYTFQSATWGAQLRYTLDGSVPTASSMLYAGPITVTDKSTVINVKAFVPGMNPSKTNMVLADFRDSGEGEGPAHWWKLDETAGASAADAAGGADGSVTAGAWGPGMIDGALDFDGTGGGVDVNDASLAGISDNFTLSFWVKPRAEIVLRPEAGDGITGDNGQQYAIAPAYRGGGTDATHAGVGVSVGTNGIAVVEHSDNYLPALLVDGGTKPDPDQWTHIAIVYKDKQPWLYVNGIFRKAGVTSTKTVHPSADIGGSGLGRLDGSIDDVRIYDRPLAIQELQVLSHTAHAPELPEFASQWKLFNSPLTEAANPTIPESGSDAILFSGDGYYTIAEGEVESANGAVLDRTVDAGQFSVVFTPKAIAGDLSAGDDSWLAVGLLDSRRYFNVLKPEQARGIVVLLRKSSGLLTVEPYKLDDTGFHAQTPLTLGTAAIDRTYELKLVELSGVWRLMVDDTQLAGDYTDMVTNVLNEQAYALIGLSDKAGGTNRVAVHSVNGEAAYGVPSRPEWRDGSLTVTDVEANRVVLHWGGATDREGVASYKIYQDGAEVAVVDGSVDNYEVTGLTPATHYSFKIEAGNAAGRWSDRGPTAETTTDYEVPENMDFAADWQLYTGRIGSAEAPTEVRLGSNGIVFMGSGYYTVAGGAVIPANGAVFKEPVDVDRFFVRFTPEQLSGSLSGGDDSWLAVSLLSSSDYFDVLRPEAGQGLVVLLRDTAGKLTVQPHKLTTAAGFQPMPSLTLDAATLQQHELKLTQTGGVWRLAMDGVLLDGDYSDMVNGVLDDKAYVQIGLSDKQNKQNRIRVHTVNDSAAYLPDWETRAMQPFWQGGIVYDEPLLMVSANQALPEAALLFEPTRIVSVRNAQMNKTYAEGVDWAYSNGKIRLLPGSAIPFMTEDELYPATVVPNESVDRRGGGGVLLHEGSYFHDRQIVVTYEHAGGGWEGPVPALESVALSRTLAKLEAGEPLKLLVLGDSIAAGANASGVTNAPPYLPDWAALLKRRLEAQYDSRITLINRSVPGQTAIWGMEEAERAADLQPDLVVVAFGMNDGVGSDALHSPALFRDHIETIMDHFRDANSDAEFILVGTTLANSETYFDGKQPLYIAELKALADAQTGVATADLTGVHAELLAHKAFADMTGNNVNHPNDYLVRWYAQTLAGMLIPGEGEVQQPQEPQSPQETHPPAREQATAADGLKISPLGKEAAASLVARSAHPASVKLTLAGAIAEVKVPDHNAEAQSAILELAYDPSLDAAGLAGLYIWNEQRSQWAYVRSAKSAADGKLSAVIQRSGIYGVLVYDRSFSDMPATHWAHQAIQSLAAAQLVQGFDDTRYGPDRQLTRAEFTALLTRALGLGLKGTGTAAPFSDVAPDAWYAQAAAAGYEAGLVEGNGRRQFEADKPVTRQEMAVMLMRACALADCAAVPELDEHSASYLDERDIAAWAKQAVGRSAELGLMRGLAGGGFSPNATATRAQAATAILRLTDLIPQPSELAAASK